MLSRFLSYIGQQHLFADGGKVLLAVSGGRDSVTLCHLMKAAGYAFDIAHCNFHLRPGDSDRDETFVRRQALQYGCRVHVAQFYTRQTAQQQGLSIEEQARNERYTYFAQLLHDEHYSCVAVAHHLDDSVETFFLNLLRGTGISGLHGIQPLLHRQATIELHGERSSFTMRVERPLLCFTRQEIDTYVQGHCLAYVEDYTNSQKEYRRNRIRQELMPLLEQLSPDFRRTMADNMRRLGEAEELYRQRVEEVRNQVTIPSVSATPSLEVIVPSHRDGTCLVSAKTNLQESGGFSLRNEEANPTMRRRVTSILNSSAVSLSLSLVRQMQPQRTLLFELLSPYGFTIGMVDDIMAVISRSPGCCFVSATHRLTLERDSLVVEPLASIPDATAEMMVPSIFPQSPDIHLPLPEGDVLSITLTTRDSLLASSDSQSRLRLSPLQACFDYAYLRQPLVLRRWHIGDRFHPFGMKGSQLVSDYFNDHKCSRSQREHCWILVDATGTILWLLGHRAASIAPVTESSQQVLLLTIIT